MFPEVSHYGQRESERPSSLPDSAKRPIISPLQSTLRRPKKGGSNRCVPIHCTNNIVTSQNCRSMYLPSYSEHSCKRDCRTLVRGLGLGLERVGEGCD